jgi:Na+/H+ antiporter NhaB
MNTLTLAKRTLSKRSIMIRRATLILEAALTTTALVGFIDVAIRIIAAAISIAVGFYLIKNYRSQTKLNNIKAEREQQELYDFLEARKKAAEAPKQQEKLP